MDRPGPPARPPGLAGSLPVTEPSLAQILREARQRRGMSLRDVERDTGIRNAHLSQLETGTIGKPEMALLWELAVLYGLDFDELLRLAGHAGAASGGRGRMTVALRALGELSPEDQAEALRYMAELKRRRAAEPEADA
jgi:transcriptional regulator with XRE-family HTH domain